MGKDFSFKNSNYSSVDSAKYPSVDARFERLESSHNAVKADFANLQLMVTPTMSTSVIQNFINSCITEGGRTVYFSAGIYDLDILTLGAKVRLQIANGATVVCNSIVIPGNSKYATISGENKRNSVIKLKSNGNLLDFTTDQSINNNVASNITIENITLDGAYLESGHLINCIGHGYCNFENVYMKGLTATGDGFHFEKSPSASVSIFDNKIVNCRIDSDAGRYGYYFKSCSDFYIVESECNGINFNMDYCIFIERCSSVTFIGGHYYNAKYNVMKMFNATWGFYRFVNVNFDNALEHIVHMYGDNTITDQSGAVGCRHTTFETCSFQAVNPNKYGLLLEGAILYTQVIDSRFIMADNMPGQAEACVKELAIEYEPGLFMKPDYTKILTAQVHNQPKWTEIIDLISGNNSYCRDVDYYNNDKVVNVSINSANDVYLISKKPSGLDLYLVGFQVVVENAATNVELKVYYGYNGGVTKYILPNTSLAVGHYTYQLTPIVADNAGGIHVVAKAYTANNVRVSAVLMEVKG